MSDGDGFRPGLREILWVAAGVVCLSFLVAAASWLFSPRPSGPAGSASQGPAIQEETVQPGRFQREVVSPGGAVPQVFSSQEVPAAPAQPQTATSLPGGLEKAAAPAAPGPHAAAPLPSTETAPSPEQEEAPLPASPPPPQSASSPGDERGRPETTPPPKPSGFGIQVGAFSSQTNARSTVGALRASGYAAQVLEREGRFKVVVIGYPSRETAEEARRSLMKKGFPNAFVVSLESP